MDLPTQVRNPPPPPSRPADAHKGTFGTVIVIGGSATMMGAPALCASAALRGGAGLVKVATPPDVLPVALTIEPSATGVLLDGEDAAGNIARLNDADPDNDAVLAVGPGWGKSATTAAFLDRLLRGKRKMVLDADGLNLLAATGKPRPKGYEACDLVMTPHPGEFRRLAKPLGIDKSPIDPDERPEAAAKLAAAHRAVVVLKGQHTVVCDTRRVYVNETGNPALATAGSGDILTGLIASLIAQGMTPFVASVLGVYLHGLAADLWAIDHGHSGMCARDLADMLPDAFQEHRDRCSEGPF